MLPPEIKKSPFHFSIRRPVSVTMIVITMTVFGILSYRLLSINMMPEISYPSLTVRTEYPGAAPEEVEDAVTRPIEQSLGVVRNLVEMSSSSRAEVSDVLFEFDWDTDMNRATQDVREKLDVTFLAEDVKPPLILRYDPSLDPIIRIGLTSDSLSLLQLRTISDEIVKRELEKLSGVAAIKVKGGEEAEIWVSVDPVKLDLLNLSMEMINRRLASENVNIAGGRLQEGETEFILRTLNEFRSVNDISDVVIYSDNNKIIRLGDIAIVERRAGEKQTIARVGGLEAVEIEIYKESDANPIIVSDLVKKRIFGLDDKMKKKQITKSKEKNKKENRRRGPQPLAEMLTDRVQIHFLSNQAEFIAQSINNVKSAALIGGILAVIVLLFFLGRLKDTLVVAVVIPVSLICAFAAMHLAGVSLNIMSLGGLALGVGMMVDNAIVVIESIHRRREEGEEAVISAVKGAKIVGGAVTASTLTTVVVFFPIVFVSGIAGQVFGDMALTVIIALSVSLIMALFFIPMLLTLRINTNDEGEDWHSPKSTPVSVWNDFIYDYQRWKSSSGIKRILSFLFYISYLLIKLILSFILNLLFWSIYYELKLVRWLIYKAASPGISSKFSFIAMIGTSFRNGISHLTDLYISVLRRLLHRPGVVIFCVIILCFVSYFILLPKLGGELIPNVSQGMFDIELTLPVGTSLEKTADIIHPIEMELTQISGVIKISSRIGGELMSAEQSTRGPNKAVISVLMEQGGNTEQREAFIVQQVRKIVSVIPSLEILITHPTLFSFKQPFEIILKGNNLDKLRKLGIEVENRLSKLPMLADVKSSVRTGHPEVIIRFDRDKLARLGFSARVIAERVQSEILGNVPTRFKEHERRIDIRIKIAEEKRESIDELRRLVINPDQKIPVTLSDIASLELVEGPAEITRVGGVRSAIVTADVIESDLKTADAVIGESLGEMNLIEGYDYVISGQKREMEESLASLKFAFLLAIFLVYVVMASQFESFRHPFLILLTIPLAVACILPVLWSLHISLSVMVFLGLIVLAGIVVNNSIVLVDYTNQLVQDGKPVYEAVLESAAARIRPILMTSLTTILALLPMALGVGEGVEIRRPMAITVIFGLSFATLITLIIIPLFYNIISKNKSKKDLSETV